MPPGQPSRPRLLLPSSSLAALALLLVTLLALAAPARAELPVIERAERAAKSGQVNPERDLAPLLAQCSPSRYPAVTVEDRRAIVEAISDLAAYDSRAPNAVKSYLYEHAPPVLLEVARTGHDAFLQGDAITALREMRAPRAVLEQAVAIAAADPDDYVKSRGEILANWMKSMPKEDAPQVAHPADAAGKSAAIAYLDKRGIGVSNDALRDAAKRADADAVKALLDAGVAADAGSADLEQTPLGLVVSQGCVAQGEETDWLVQTIQLLIDKGADVRKVDDNRNTALIHAAQWCGPRVAAVLAAAPHMEISHKNGSGLSAFGIAIVMGKLDTAAVLVAKGARIGADEKKMLDGSATTARAKELVAKAARAK